ncbi:82_t:CDS:2, partial [Funneliformis geosporum]
MAQSLKIPKSTLLIYAESTQPSTLTPTAGNVKYQKYLDSLQNELWVNSAIKRHFDEIILIKSQ